MIMLGMRQAVLAGDEIWYCVQCFSCSFHCPQEVHFAEVIKGLRRLSVADGHVTSSFAEAVDNAGRLLQKLRVRLLEKLLEAKQSEEMPELDSLLRQIVDADLHIK